MPVRARMQGCQVSVAMVTFCSLTPNAVTPEKLLLRWTSRRVAAGPFANACGRMGSRPTNERYDVHPHAAHYDVIEFSACAPPEQGDFRIESVDQNIQG